MFSMTPSIQSQIKGCNGRGCPMEPSDCEEQFTSYHKDWRADEEDGELEEEDQWDEDEEWDEDSHNEGQNDESSTDEETEETEEIGRFRIFYLKSNHSFGYIESLSAPDGV